MPTWENLTPYTDEYTRSRRITATNVLIALNGLGFLLMGILPYLLGINIDALFFNARFAIGKLWLWQFLTYSFMNPVDPYSFFWLILTCFTLYNLGNELEAEIGRVRYVLSYLACAFYGALAHALYQFAANSQIPAMSLFAPFAGILAASALRYPGRTMLFFFVIPMRIITVALLMGAVLIFYCAIYFRHGMSPFAVLAGGLTGVALVKLEPKLDGFLERLASRRERDRIVEDVEIRREVDRILEKINREGIGSLSRSEKRTLKRGSELLNRARRSE